MMGMIPPELQQTVAQIVQPGMVTFEWLFRVIIMPLLLGSYVYTWLSIRGIAREVRDMKDNHILHMKEEIAEIKAKLED